MKTYYTISNYENPKFACTMCNPCMLEIGIAWGRCVVYNEGLEQFGVRDIWGKEYKEGRFAILSGQGHGEDESLFFNMDPSTYFDEEYTGYFDYCQPVLKSCSCFYGWDNVQFAIQNNWYCPERDGFYDECFLEVICRLVNAWKRKYKTTPQELFKSRSDVIINKIREKSNGNSHDV